MEEQPSVLHIWSSPSSLTTFGHISLQLMSNKCYISFWPRKGTNCWDILNKRCPAEWYQTVKEEIKVNGHPTSVFIYGLDVTAIKLWWDKFISYEPKYDIREQNCASVVYNALCAGSSWFEKNTGECAGIKTPTRVFQYVQNGYNKGTKIGCGRSCTHCLSLYPYLVFGFFSNNVDKFMVLAQKYLQFRHTPEQGKIVKKCELEDTSSNVEESDESIKDVTVCQDLHEKKENLQPNVQQENLEDFIDLRTKGRRISLPDIKFFCQPDRDTYGEAMLVPLTGENGVRYRT
ncbi:uncharacterized protein LOC123524889 [Mercenaria mercenaria]|uniref:uncharacterized protein LOC123524889 n=1 Tax=Mercenaria mercenaria TaxID=6596 RepID=UPI00234EF076|nr:uncharacterized protein LOC123524889 [Mercenaria mercenaria]